MAGKIIDFDSILAFLQKYRWIHDLHLVRFFESKVLEEMPDEWRQAFSHMSLRDLNLLPFLNSTAAQSQSHSRLQLDSSPASQPDPDRTASQAIRFKPRPASSKLRSPIADLELDPNHEDDRSVPDSKTDSEAFSKSDSAKLPSEPDSEGEPALKPGPQPAFRHDRSRAKCKLGSEKPAREPDSKPGVTSEPEHTSQPRFQASHLEPNPSSKADPSLPGFQPDPNTQSKLGSEKQANKPELKPDSNTKSNQGSEKPVSQPDLESDCGTPEIPDLEPDCGTSEIPDLEPDCGTPEIPDLEPDCGTPEIPDTLHPIPRSLSEFLATASSFSLDRQQVGQGVPSPTTVDKELSRGMSPKKRHEVAWMASLVHQVAARARCTAVVDVGSGLGYLGQLLHKTYGLSVIGVESSQGHTEGAERRAVKRGLGCSGLKTVSFLITDEDDNADRFCEAIIDAAASFQPCQHSANVQPCLNVSSVQPCRNTPPVQQCKDSPPVQQCQNSPCVQQCKDSPSVQQCKDSPSVQQCQNYPSIQQCKDSPSVQQCKDSPSVQCCQNLTSVQSCQNSKEHSSRDKDTMTSGEGGDCDTGVSRSKGDHCEDKNARTDGGGGDSDMRVSRSKGDHWEDKNARTDGGGGDSDMRASLSKGDHCENSTMRTDRGVGACELRVCLIGLHCCGDLTPAMLRLYHRVGLVRALVCVSCCYHKMQPAGGSDKFRNFPMSQAAMESYGKVCRQGVAESPSPTVAAAPGFLTTPSLRLAAQETRMRWAAQNQEDHGKHVRRVGYRAILQVFLEERGGHCEHDRKSIRRLDYTSFDRFVESYISSAGLSDVQDQESTRVKFNELYLLFHPYLTYIQPFTCLQVALQPVLESFVVWDRQRWLQEQDLDAEVVAIFDDNLSPRNLALVSIKSPGFKS